MKKIKIAVHPSEFIKDLLDSNSMSQKELALRTGLTPKTISAIMKSKAGISIDTAKMLETVLGVPVSFWLNAQANYDEYQKALEEDRVLLSEQLPLYEKFKISPIYNKLKKLEILEDMKSKSSVISSLLSFFGVSSFDFIEQAYESKLGMAWTRSDKNDIDKYHFIAWLRCGQLEQRETVLPSFDRKKFKGAIKESRSLASKDLADVFGRIKKIYAQAGVFLTHTQSFPKSKAFGFTEWIGDTPLIHLSLKGSADERWHALFHESKHILQERKKKCFVTFNLDKDENDEDELEAHEFASEILISKDSLKYFANTKNINRTSVMKFARDNNVTPAVIVAQLQRLEYLEYGSSLSSLKTSKKIIINLK